MDGYEARYQGDWIDPSPEDVERGKAEQPVDHHKYWDLALHNVLQKVERGDKGPFDVHRKMKVDHNSPGWVDGYRVDLS
jgi:hypothetical protein